MTEPNTVSLATNAMGTRFELVLFGDDATLLRAAGEEAIELIEDAHRRLSRFERGSVVSEINASAGVGAVRVDDELFGLLERCEGYRADSLGAFSVVFDSERRPERERGLSENASESRLDPEEPSLPLRPPFREKTGLLLNPESRQVALPNQGLDLDLGGVAKGFALDLASEALRDAGLDKALLHGGSSTTVAIGGPWTLELPRNANEADSPVVSLHNRSLSVSSQQGERPGHVIDPRTGETARRSLWAACIGPRAEETDAWATALVVLGERPPAMPGTLTSLPRSAGCDTLASNEPRP